MPRPCKRRRIRFRANVEYFKPVGIPVSELEEIDLKADELEALRLSDLHGLSQNQASMRMEISQPTFNRILSSARKKIARAVVAGKALRIDKK